MEHTNTRLERRYILDHCSKSDLYAAIREFVEYIGR